MGTRGGLGFRANDTDKIMYQQYDSYPSGVGHTALSFIANSSKEELLKMATNIELIARDKKPTKEQIKHCKPWTDLGVGEQSTSDWYCLLRRAQGELQPFRDGLKYVLDNSDFLKDSLFCEYAYIINTDSGKLEFYRGFQKSPGIGRYAQLSNEPGDYKGAQRYYGVSLALEIPLDDIIGADAEKIDKFVDLMDASCRDEDDEDEIPTLETARQPCSHVYSLPAEALSSEQDVESIPSLDTLKMLT